MRDLGAPLQERDFGKDPLSESELQTLIGEADIAAYLNTRTPLYRAQNMKTNPPTKAQAIKLMVQDPNLLKRPIAVRGRTRVLGFDAEKLRVLVASR